MSESAAQWHEYYSIMGKHGLYMWKNQMNFSQLIQIESSLDCSRKYKNGQNNDRQKP